MAAHLRGISKRFGFTAALAGVDLTIRSGEVLALLGENGAGKSTLVKVLTGVIAPDAGAIEIDGVEHDALTPRRAEELGIARVAQELSLFPEMDVAANVLIGREPRRFGLVDRRGAAAPHHRAARPARRPPRSPAAGAPALARRAPARRDRQGDGPHAAHPRPRRTDVRAARARGGATVRRDQRPARAGVRRRVHQPPLGRGVRHRRSHHRAQGRAQLG